MRLIIPSVHDLDLTLDWVSMARHQWKARNLLGCWQCLWVARYIRVMEVAMKMNKVYLIEIAYKHGSPVIPSRIRYRRRGSDHLT